MRRWVIGRKRESPARTRKKPGLSTLLRVLFAVALLSAGLPPLAGTASADAVMTGNLEVGWDPYAIAVNPVTNKIYVANYSESTVSVVDGATHATTTVTVGMSPCAVAINSVTNKIYVAICDESSVAVIDGATNQVEKVGTGSNPDALAVNPVTNKIYVANNYSSSVTVIDGASHATTTVTTGSGPRAVAINYATNQIYVANSGDGNVTVIDGSTNETSTVETGSSPYAVAVNPVTNKVYVTNNGSDSVTVIDGASHATTSVPVGSSPRGVAVNPVTNKIYVANYNDGGVTIINGATNATSNIELKSAYSLNTYPNEVAVNPLTNKIYVTSDVLSRTLFVIDGTSQSSTSIPVSYPSAVAINSVTNKIYVTDYWAGWSSNKTITVIDGATNGTSTIGTGANPDAVAVNSATNKIYVANYNDNSVSVVDGATDQTSKIGTGLNPDAVAVNPVTNQIYVANRGDGSITVVDGATNRTSTVPAGSSPVAIAVNPVTNKVYVANFDDNSVTVIDGASHATTTLPVGASPRAIAINSATNKIYVANSGDGHVTVIDGSTNETVTVESGSTPCAIAVNPVTNKIYVANYSDNSVTVIDGATNETSKVETGTNPDAVAVNPATNKIYVANSTDKSVWWSDNSVTVIDGATNGTTMVGTGALPAALAINPASNRVYVANSDGSSVTVIDGTTNQPITVPAGGSPAAIAANPATNKIYVANQSSSNVTVIDGAGNTSNPLQVAIFPWKDNIVYGNHAAFTFYASSSYHPYTPDVRKVYYQLDTMCSAWQEAEMTNGVWKGAVSSLSLGEHVLYAIAADSQDTAGGMGAVAAYAFTVLPLSGNANLSALSLSAGELRPSFDPEKTNYSVQLPASAESVDLTAAVADSDASLKVNGRTAASGTASTIALQPGSNVVTVQVTAADGSAKTYTVTIDRADVNLGGLSVSPGTLDPSFDPNTLVYAVKSDDPLTQIDVSAATEDAGASISIAGGTASQASVIQSVYLDQGTNFIPIVVNSASGLSARTYVLTVNGTVGSDELSGLTLSAGTLSPEFAADTTAYSAEVDHGVDTIDITATLADSRSFLTIAGRPASSGAPYTVSGLLEGSNTIPITVFAPNGTARTYTLTVHRDAAPPSQPSRLALDSDSYRLESGSTHNTVVYAVYTDGAMVPVTAQAEYATSDPSVAAVGPDGQVTALAAGKATIQASYGGLTAAVQVEVLAAPEGGGGSGGGGSMTDAAAVAADKAALAIGYSGTDSALSVTKDIALPTAGANGSTIIWLSSSGAIGSTGAVTRPSPSAGDVPVTLTAILFKGAAWDKATFTVLVKHAEGGNDADLSGLTLSSAGLSPAFASDTTSYTSSVANSVSSITVTPTVSDSGATVKVNGKAVTSGTASGAINLNVGSNTITVVATAQDGTTTKTYTVTVSRAEPAVSSPSSPPSVPAPPDDGKVISTNGELSLPAGKTGEVSLGDAVTISIPANATDKDLKLTIEKVLDTQNLLTDNDILVSPVYEILKNFLENFDQPVTLTFAFDPTSLKNNQRAAVFYYDEAKKEWVNVGGVVNGDKITVEVNHFTKYAVFAVAENPEAEDQFSDISGHWAEASIHQAVSSGMVKGYPDGTFKPNHTVTREEFAVMLMNALKPQGNGAQLAFTDKAKIGEWASAAVAQAVQAGIISGYTDGSFRPEAEITRAEMASMIARVLGPVDEPDAATGFADDRSIPSWAKGAVAALKNLGIIGGKGGNTFDPNGKATRAEAVTILMKMLAQKNK